MGNKRVKMIIFYYNLIFNKKMNPQQTLFFNVLLQNINYFKITKYKFDILKNFKKIKLINII